MTLPRSYRIASKSEQDGSSLNSSPWSNLQPLSIDHYLWMDNGYAPEVEIKLYSTSERLCLQFQVYEENPLVRYHALNEPVHKDSCVEFFFQPLPDSDPRYFNFEMNAAGTLLLGLGTDRNDRERLADYPPDLFQIRTAAGCLDPDNGRTYWTLELSIPFDWIQSRFKEFSPEAGHRLRANFYKCGDETPLPHFGCWNLVTAAKPDFHRSGDFGELVLG